MTRVSLTVLDLAKTFAPNGRDPVVAVDGVSLDVQPGQLFTLLGPSGCGKTTILRCIAGLEAPERGTIVVGDRVLFSAERGVSVRANERGLGLVFQSYAIWPHMNVFDNVAFPLMGTPRRRRLPRPEIRARVERVLALVHLDGVASRGATDLSGGQQQRLALARSLVMEPPVLLLDEPLSNLDAKLRAEMRFELKRIQAELGVTTVYVTHDQEEALALSTVIAVMHEGRVEQVGRPREVYQRPHSRFVADFIGAANLIDGVVDGTSNGACIVRTEEGMVRTADGGKFPAGTRVVVVVRAEHVEVDAGLASGGVNTWRGVVQTPAFLGGVMDHEIAIGRLRIRARTEPSLAIPPGGEVTVSFRAEDCVVIPAGR
jgi:iron(III) transport system ATP-binding protein